MENEAGDAVKALHHQLGRAAGREVRATSQVLLPSLPRQSFHGVRQKFWSRASKNVGERQKSLYIVKYRSRRQSFRQK